MTPISVLITHTGQNKTEITLSIIHYYINVVCANPSMYNVNSVTAINVNQLQMNIV